jgi:hypothetical protein
LSSFDSNYGEHYERDLYEAGAYERELAAEELEHVERERTDSLRRDWPAHAWCAVCNEKRAHGIYGGKCRGCFEAQREERDAA